MESWYVFFSAEVASTAALAGLLFVALSVNVARILQFSWLPARAAQTLVVLMGALAVSSLMLFPGAEHRLVSYLTLAVSLVTYFFAGKLADAFQEIPAEWRAKEHYKRAVAINLVASQIATLPVLAGSILVVAGAAGGYYSIACGVILALAFGLLNSWVLLIEILR